MGNIGRVMARVDWSYQSKIYFEASNTPLEVQDGVGLFYGRIGLHGFDDSWEISLWGKNIGDKLVKTHVVAFAPFGQQLNLYNPPRTYGMTLRFKM